MGHQVNFQRPSNPFVRSGKPDWVVPGGIDKEQILCQPRETELTPSEHIVRTSRRFPLLSDADHHPPPNVTNMHGGVRKSQPNMTTSASELDRKAAPPVPKKPAVLQSSNSQRDLRGSIDSQQIPDSQIGPSNPSSTRNTSSRLGTNLSFPPLPHRSARPLQKAPDIRTRHSYESKEGSRPPQGLRGSTDGLALLPRPDQSFTSHSGLLDEDVTIAPNIPSLEPIQRG